MASLMDWITAAYEEKSAGVILSLRDKLKNEVHENADQCLVWDAEVCTLGEDSTPIEEALFESLGRFPAYFLFRNGDEIWRFSRFATSWVIRIIHDGPGMVPDRMAVVKSEEYRPLDAEGIRA